MKEAIQKEEDENQRNKKGANTGEEPFYKTVPGIITISIGIVLTLSLITWLIMRSKQATNGKKES